MNAEALTSGVVTFLFTDIEGSTRRWESDPEVMRAALAAHARRSAPSWFFSGQQQFGDVALWTRHRPRSGG